MRVRACVVCAVHVHGARCVWCSGVCGAAACAVRAACAAHVRRVCGPAHLRLLPIKRAALRRGLELHSLRPQPREVQGRAVGGRRDARRQLALRGLRAVVPLDHEDEVVLALAQPDAHVAVLALGVLRLLLALAQLAEQHVLPVVVQQPQVPQLQP